MASVNDYKRPDEWRKEVTGDEVLESDVIVELARTAWHPVSEPPTEDDANDTDGVMVETKDGRVASMCWHEVPEWEPDLNRWARISDVVLMPEGD